MQDKLQDKASEKSPATTELNDSALDGVAGGSFVGPSPTPGITTVGPKGVKGIETPPSGGGGIGGSSTYDPTAGVGFPKELHAQPE